MNDDGLIREVDEAMRRDRVQGFFNHFGRYIVAITLLILVTTVAVVSWQSSMESAREARTLQLYEAIRMVEEGKSYQARELFETLADSETDNVTMLADLWQIKLKHMAGKPEEAEAMAREAHERYGSAIPYADWLTLYLAAEDTASMNNVFRLTNMERRAVAHLEKNELTEAAALYDVIAQDSETPPTMTERATLLLTTRLKSAYQTLQADRQKATSLATDTANSEESVSEATEPDDDPLDNEQE